jgi:kynurenine formamidase
MLFDLSHAIEHGTRTYPGLPAPAVSEFLTREDSRARYAPGTEFSIGRIDMVGNTGTYLDSPFHRYPRGADLSDLPLSRIADLPGIVVRASSRSVREIGPEVFGGRDLAGRAVLVHTGWSRQWGTAAYFEGHPYLTEKAAELLVGAGIALAGIDSLNIDRIEGGERPAHSLLLAAGIPIVEHMTALDGLPEGDFRFFAVPPKIRGFGTFPVRAFALF